MEEPGASLTTVLSLFILLPGFVSLFAERALASGKDEQFGLTVARALIYSLFDYTIVALVRPSVAAWVVSPPEKGTALVAARSLPGDLAALLSVSVLVGIVWGVVRAYDLTARLAWRLRLSTRSHRGSVFQGIVEQPYLASPPAGPFVVVTLCDGRRLMGWPLIMSDSYDDDLCLFLTDAAWVSEDGHEQPMPNPGILVRGKQIELLQFVNQGRGDDTQ